MPTIPDGTVIAGDPDVTEAKAWFANMVDYYNTKVTELAAETTAMMAKVYPVGCIYQSVVATAPATLFGFGTWAALGAGRVLVGIDPSDPAFDAAEETGGSKTTSIAHTHAGGAHAHAITDHQHAGADHLHTVAGTAITIDQMPSHTHRGVLTWPNKTNYKVEQNQTAGEQDYSDIDGISTSTGGNQPHSHGLSGADRSLTTGGLIAAASTGQGGAVNTGAMSANASPSVVQPYIVVYRWKRTA